LTALLRLRHRALAAPADHEPDRGQHRDRPAAVPA
jgi:hypothetical protein